MTIRYFKCPYALDIFRYIFGSDDLLDLASRKHDLAESGNIYMTLFVQMILNRINDFNFSSCRRKLSVSLKLS